MATTAMSAAHRTPPVDFASASALILRTIMTRLLTVSLILLLSLFSLLAEATPTVTLTSPANGATVTAPASVTLTADATASDGTITQVAFYANGAQVATLTAAPYTYAWSNVTPGGYKVYAQAYSSDGSVGESATVAITVTPPAAPLKLHWPLDATSGNTAADASGNGNAGTLLNGPTWGAGRVGAALTFDGVDDALTRATVTGLASGNSAHTLAAWVKVNALPATRAWILLLGNEAAGAHHWLLKSTGATQLGAWEGGQLTPTLPVGQWTHVALSFDGTTLRSYLNGSLTGSVAARFNLAGVPFRLAKPRATENYFNGQLDEVRIYGAALSAPEIAALADAGAPANQAPTVSLTAPANNTVVTAPATVTLTASAADSDGLIAQVAFYQGTTLIGTAPTAPYTTLWTAVPAGTYSLTAQATDAQGATTTSAPTTLTVTAAAAQLYYLHTDHLDTPRLVTDETNKTVWRNTPLAEPFGMSPPDEDPDGDGHPFTLNLRFPGQVADKETNTNYNVFRDYNPEIGRYIQSDPIGLDGGINTYAYVDSNPLGDADPLGLAGNSSARQTYYPRGQMPRPPAVTPRETQRELLETIADFLDPYNPNFGKPIPGWPSTPKPYCRLVCPSDTPHSCPANQPTGMPKKNLLTGEMCTQVCDSSPRLTSTR